VFSTGAGDNLLARPSRDNEKNFTPARLLPERGPQNRLKNPVAQILLVLDFAGHFQEDRQQYETGFNKPSAGWKAGC